MQYQIVHRGMASLLRVRFWMAEFIYDRLLIAVVSDEGWLEKLFSSFAASPGHEILVLGSHSSSVALALSRRFPAANFKVIDADKKALARTRREILHRKLSNIHLARFPDTNVLAFDNYSFHQVVCFLALHKHQPDEKLLLLKEMARVLRRGGVLHAVEFDKPKNSEESKMLRVAGRKSRNAVISHISGTWLSFFAKAGFSRVGRQSSHSIRAGRLSVINARK